MKTLRLFCLAGLLACTACVQPTSSPEPAPELASERRIGEPAPPIGLEPLALDFDPFARAPWMPLRFHNDDATAIDASWVFGEVTGVTPEFYEVGLDRTQSTTPGGSVRFEGQPGGAYHTMWTELVIPASDAAFLMELQWDQLPGDASMMPFVWVRLDGEAGMLGMTDSRSQEKTAPGVWETCSLKVAIPKEAQTAVIGIGMLGHGWVHYDNMWVLSGEEESDAAASAEAQDFVDRFLEIVQADAMMRDNVDWKQMRLDMTSLTRHAETTADTYPALRFCLESLGDHHSRLLTPAFMAARGGGDAEEEEVEEVDPSTYVMPRHERMTGDLGYLWLPGHLSFGDAGPRAYAWTLARALEELEDCKGFVIDLRDNGGGNMWPMLAGLGPLLGAEVVGSFTYPDGTADTWWYRENQSGQADIPCTQVVPPHGASFAKDIPLAILTSRRTGSSGEATLVSFLGRSHVRTFGQATTGLSTGNSSIPLSDGSMLLLTTSVYADRHGREFGGRIEPDVAVDAHGEGDQDAALQAAIAWLSQ